MAASFRAKVRRWGSSVAVVVPPDVTRAEKVAIGDEVELTIRRPTTFEDLFGAAPGATRGFLDWRLRERAFEKKRDRQRFGAA